MDDYTFQYISQRNGEKVPDPNFIQHYTINRFNNLLTRIKVHSIVLDDTPKILPKLNKLGLRVGNILYLFEYSKPEKSDPGYRSIYLYTNDIDLWVIGRAVVLRDKTLIEYEEGVTDPFFFIRNFDENFSPVFRSGISSDIPGFFIQKSLIYSSVILEASLKLKFN